MAKNTIVYYFMIKDVANKRNLEELTQKKLRDTVLSLKSRIQNFIYGLFFFNLKTLCVEEDIICL